MKTGVPGESPLCLKVGVPPYKKYSLLQKLEVPAPKMGVQDCESVVSKVSDYIMYQTFFLTIFQVKVILEPSLQNECIEAQLYTYGCHGDGTCPTVSHTQRSGAEETYLLFNVVG